MLRILSDIPWRESCWRRSVSLMLYSLNQCVLSHLLLNRLDLLLLKHSLTTIYQPFHDDQLVDHSTLPSTCPITTSSVFTDTIPAPQSLPPVPSQLHPQHPHPNSTKAPPLSSPQLNPSTSHPVSPLPARVPTSAPSHPLPSALQKPHSLHPDPTCPPSPRRVQTA